MEEHNVVGGMPKALLHPNSCFNLHQVELFSRFIIVDLYLLVLPLFVGILCLILVLLCSTF